MREAINSEIRPYHEKKKFNFTAVPLFEAQNNTLPNCQSKLLLLAGPQVRPNDSSPVSQAITVPLVPSPTVSAPEKKTDHNSAADIPMASAGLTHESTREQDSTSNSTATDFKPMVEETSDLGNSSYLSSIKPSVTSLLQQKILLKQQNHGMNISFTTR